MLVGEERLEDAVVLQQEVEVDQVVEGEGRALGKRVSGVVLLIEEGARALQVVGAGDIDVDAGGDEQRDDLPVGALLDRVEAVGAGEPVGSVVPTLSHRQQDVAGSHVHFPAVGARRPDGRHLRTCIGSRALILQLSVPDGGYPSRVVFGWCGAPPGWSARGSLSDLPHGRLRAAEGRDVRVRMRDHGCVEVL